MLIPGRERVRADETDVVGPWSARAEQEREGDPCNRKQMIDVAKASSQPALPRDVGRLRQVFAGDDVTTRATPVSEGRHASAAARGVARPTQRSGPRSVWNTINTPAAMPAGDDEGSCASPRRQRRSERKTSVRARSTWPAAWPTPSGRYLPGWAAWNMNMLTSGSSSDGTSRRQPTPRAACPANSSAIAITVAGALRHVPVEGVEPIQGGSDPERDGDRECSEQRHDAVPPPTRGAAEAPGRAGAGDRRHG